MAPDTFSSRDVCKMQHNLTQCQYTTQLAALVMSAKCSTILLSASIPHNLHLWRCLQNTAQSYSVPAYHTTCSSCDVCKMQHNLTQCQHTTQLAALATSAKCSTILLSASIPHYLQLSRCLQNAAQSYSVPVYNTTCSSRNVFKVQHNLTQCQHTTQFQLSLSLMPTLHCPVLAPSHHFTVQLLPHHHPNTSLPGSCHHPTTSPLHCLVPATIPPLHCLVPATIPPLHCLVPATIPPLHCLVPATIPTLHCLVPATIPPLHCLVPATIPTLHCLVPATIPTLHCLVPVTIPPLHCLVPATIPTLHCLVPATTPPLHCLVPATIPPLHCFTVWFLPPSHHFTVWFLPPSHHFTVWFLPPSHHFIIWFQAPTVSNLILSELCINTSQSVREFLTECQTKSQSVREFLTECHIKNQSHGIPD